MYYLRKVNQFDTNLNIGHSVVEEREDNLIKMKYYPYAADLAFWLDGVEKGDTEDAWTDKINGYVFNNYGAVAENNCWFFKNDGTTYFENNDSFSFPVSNCTIEAVYSSVRVASDTQGSVIYVPKTAGDISFGVTDDCLTIGTNSSTNYKFKFGKTITYDENVHTISMNKNTALCDINYEVISKETNYWGTSTQNRIGRRSNGSYRFSGRVYAIRIYNRLLTIDEMRKNQLADMSRYEL